MDGWMGGWMGGWVDGWRGGWMDRWVGGSSPYMSVLCPILPLYKDTNPFGVGLNLVTSR